MEQIKVIIDNQVKMWEYAETLRTKWSEFVNTEMLKNIEMLRNFGKEFKK